MQDGAPVHRAKNTKRNMGDVRLEWPASSSPDLNPIEILWWNIKDKLDRVPVRPTTVTEMRLELQAMWENLNPQSWYIIVPTYILVSRLLLLQMVDTHNTSLTLGHYYIIIYLFFFIFLFSYHSCSSYGIASSAPSSVQSYIYILCPLSWVSEVKCIYPAYPDSATLSMTVQCFTSFCACRGYIRHDLLLCIWF